MDGNNKKKTKSKSSTATSTGSSGKKRMSILSWMKKSNAKKGDDQGANAAKVSERGKQKKNVVEVEEDESDAPMKTRFGSGRRPNTRLGMAKKRRRSQEDVEDEVVLQPLEMKKKRKRVASPKKSTEESPSARKRKSKAVTIVDSDDNEDEDYVDENGMDDDEEMQDVDVLQEEEENDAVAKKKQKKQPQKTAKSKPSEKVKRKQTTESVAEEEPSLSDKDAETPVPAPANFSKRRWFEPRGYALNKGSKKIPVGKPDCLDDKLFCITGQLESLEREEAEDLIKQYGGLVKKNVIKKLNYLIVGEEPGKSKTEKAKQYRIKFITEDDLLDMIRRSNPEQKDTEAVETPPLPFTAETASTSSSVSVSPSKRQLSITKKTPPKHAFPPPAASSSSSSSVSTVPTGNNLWVEKYRPLSVKSIMGNNMHVQRMIRWLNGWEKNHLHGEAIPTKTTSKGKGRDKKATGGGSGMSKVEALEVDIETKKAVLVSGIAGIGKTSAAKAVCHHCGYDFVELNASDTRSKKSLRAAVEGMVTNRSLSEFFTSAKGKNVTKKKVCLIMDEVDGMSGDDRGGLGELVQMIKETQIPIICICNDHSNQKLKTLIKYSMDLQFARPNRETMAKRITEICSKEGVKVEKNAVLHLLDSLGGDIRSVLNNLQLMAKSSNDISYLNTKATGTTKTSRQVSIFDVIADVFRSHKDYKLAMDNYFYDTMLVPAFVQENYVNMRPSVPGLTMTQRTKMLSTAAEAMSEGDLIGRQIRREQQWTLAPSHAHVSTIYPGYVMRGIFEAQRAFDRFYRFPASLGKLSTQTKNLGLIGQMQKASSLRSTGTRTDILLDYLPVWKHTLLEPVMQNGKEGIDDTINRMDEYDLSREDLESINELTIFDKKKDKNTWKGVPTQVKTALTREYNKRHAAVSKARKTRVEMREEEEEMSNDDEADDEESQEKVARSLDDFAKQIKLHKSMDKFDKRTAAAAAKGKGKKKPATKKTTTKKPAKPKSGKKSK